MTAFAIVSVRKLTGACEWKKGLDWGRVFYLWNHGALRTVFEKLNLTVVDFSRAISKIRKSDVWLGYVLKKQGFGGNQDLV